MERPKELFNDGTNAFYHVEVHPLNREINRSLSENGEFMFSSSQQVLDVFGLALKKEDSVKAIDTMLTFTKQLKQFKCQMMNFGLRVADMQEEKLALTYTIQSFKYKNDPLWVNEIFTPKVPLMAIANEMASLWIQAYKSRPEIDILKIANGK